MLEQSWQRLRKNLHGVKVQAPAEAAKKNEADKGLHKLKNRVIMGSMHTGMEDFGVVKGGHNQRGGLAPLAKYFEERAKGGVGLIVTGGIAPNREGKVSPWAGKMSNKLESRAHRDITEAVHRHDSKIVMQILHAGRYGYHFWNVAPSAIKAPIGWFEPKALESSKRRIHHSGFCQLRSVRQGSWVRRSRSDGK